MRPNIPILDADEATALLAKVDMPGVLRRLFADLHAGQAVQPPQTLALFPKDAGDVILYPAVLGEAETFGVKLSPYIVAEPKPLITAWTLLMSMRTGQPLLLCDAGKLTTERTAGTTALAVDLLAAADASTLAIVGTGPVAEAHLRHVLALRPWRNIRITSRSVADRPAAEFAHLTALDPRVELCSSVDDAVRDADVVLLCTSSGTPVLDLAGLGRPALITSISTNVARAHEIDPAALAGLEVYCDYRATAPLSAGEMVIAQEQHGWSPDAIRGDLAELVAGVAPGPDRGRHTFFRSIGMGLEDIAVASALHSVLMDQTGDPRP